MAQLLAKKSRSNADAKKNHLAEVAQFNEMIKCEWCRKDRERGSYDTRFVSQSKEEAFQLGKQKS